MSELVAILRRGVWRYVSQMQRAQYETLEEYQPDYGEFMTVVDSRYRWMRDNTIVDIPDEFLQTLVAQLPDCGLEYPRPIEEPEPEPEPSYPSTLSVLEYVHSPLPEGCVVGCVRMWYDAMRRKYYAPNPSPNPLRDSRLSNDDLSMWIGEHIIHGDKQWANNGDTLRGMANLLAHESHNAIWMQSHYAAQVNNQQYMANCIFAGLKAGEPVLTWVQASNQVTNHVYLVTGYEEIEIPESETELLSRFIIMDPHDPDVHYLQGYRPSVNGGSLVNYDYGVIATIKFVNWVETMPLAMSDLSRLTSRIEILEQTIQNMMGGA